MADGTLIFKTALDAKDLSSGLKGIKNTALAAFGVSAKAVAAVTGAMSAGAAAAINMGSSFEAAMSNVAAISGAYGEDLQKLTDKAKELGKTTKFSASESAEAMNYMAMAGWKTEDMLNGLDGILSLAAASGESLATTSDIVTDALTAFGMGADQSGNFANVLAAASSNANTNVSMMGETFKYVAPVAGALGYTAEDTAVAIGLMANAGIKGGQAGTSLRAMLSRLAKPTDEVATAMDTLGVSLTKSDGSMKTLDEIMGDLRNGFDGLSEAESANIATSLAGQEAMSGLLAIVGASDEDFNKLKESIYNCDGAAGQMADTMQNNLKGKITILKSALEGLGIEVYESMEAPLKDAAGIANGYIDELSQKFDENGAEGLVMALGKIVADLVTRGAEYAPKMIEISVGFIRSLVTGITSNLPQIGKAGISIIKTLYTELHFGDAVQWGIDAGLELMQSLTNGIKDNFPALVPAAMDTLTRLSGSLRENAGKIFDAGLALIMQLAKSLIDNIPVFVETVPTIIINICGIINDNAPKLLVAGLSLIAQLALGLVKAIPTIIVNMPKIIQAIISVITAVNWLNLGKSIIEGLVKGVKSLAHAIPTAFREFCTNARGIVSNWGWGGLGKAVITMLKNGISSMASGIVTTLKNIGKNAIDVFKNIKWKEVGFDIVSGICKGISGGLGNLISSATEMGQSLLGSVKSFFGINSPSKVMAEQGDYLVQGMINGLTTLPGKSEKIFSDVLAKTLYFGMDLNKKAAKSGSDFQTSLMNYMQRIPGQAMGWFEKTIDKASSFDMSMRKKSSDAGSNFQKNLMNYMQQLPGQSWNWLSKTISKAETFRSDMISKAAKAGKGFSDNITSAMSGLPGQMEKIGSNIVSGIWNGISSGWDWLTKKVKGLADDLYEAAKDALGIHSPSKKFAYIGEMCVEGMDEPIRKYNPYGTLKASLLSGMSAFGGKNMFGGFGSRGSINNFNQTFNIYQQVKSPSELMRAARLEARYGMAGAL